MLICISRVLCSLLCSTVCDEPGISYGKTKKLLDLIETRNTHMLNTRKHTRMNERTDRNTLINEETENKNKDQDGGGGVVPDIDMCSFMLVQDC